MVIMVKVVVIMVIAIRGKVYGGWRLCSVSGSSSPTARAADLTSCSGLQCFITVLFFCAGGCCVDDGIDDWDISRMLLFDVKWRF